jgi:hypothetical protein
VAEANRDVTLTTEALVAAAVCAQLGEKYPRRIQGAPVVKALQVEPLQAF